MKVAKTKFTGMMFIILAIACASIAAFIVVQAGIKAAPTVPVLQVKEDIAPGDFVQDKVTTIKVASSSVPKGAIKPGADLSKAVAKHGLSQGDILRVDHLIDEKIDSGLLSARLRALGDSNLRAAELPIDSVAGMLGGMKAGDRIDVIAVYEEENGNIKNLISKTILTNRQLIGVRVPQDSSSGGSLVVAVTAQEAETLALYREKGKLFITLKPFGKGGV